LQKTDRLAKALPEKNFDCGLIDFAHSLRPLAWTNEQHCGRRFDRLPNAADRAPYLGQVLSETNLPFFYLIQNDGRYMSGIYH
jgi:hypothetical protein